MPPVGFGPAVPARERLHTQALERASPGIGCTQYHVHIIICGNLGTPASEGFVDRLTGDGRSSIRH